MDQGQGGGQPQQAQPCFEEATEFFTGDGDYLVRLDDQAGEERFVGLGPIRRGIIVIVWTEPSDDVTRIISARFATKREIADYRRHMEGNDDE